MKYLRSLKISLRSPKRNLKKNLSTADRLSLIPGRVLPTPLAKWDLCPVRPHAWWLNCILFCPKIVLLRKTFSVDSGSRYRRKPTHFQSVAQSTPYIARQNQLLQSLHDTLPYCSETWPTYMHQEGKHNGFHMRCLRSIGARIRWRDMIRNEIILQLNGCSFCFSYLKTRRLLCRGPAVLYVVGIPRSFVLILFIGICKGGYYNLCVWSQKGTLYFTHAVQTHYSLNTSLIFNFVWEVAFCVKVHFTL